MQDSISGASRTRPGTLFAFLLLSLLAHRALAEPEAIRLWPQGAPGSEGQNSPEIVRINEYGEHIVSNVHFPSITPYLPATDHSTRAAVVVVPGGGHRELWMDHEGYSVARYLAAHGVAAFVLKYRLAREERSPYTVEGSAAHRSAARDPAGAEQGDRVARGSGSYWCDGLLGRWRIGGALRHPATIAARRIHQTRSSARARSLHL